MSCRGDRLRATGDIPFMGQRFQASAMMSVGVAERKIKLQVQEVMLGTLLLPIDLDAIFAQPINRELAQIIEDGQFDVLHVGTASDRLVLYLASRSAAAPLSGRSDNRGRLVNRGALAHERPRGVSSLYERAAQEPMTVWDGGTLLRRHQPTVHHL